MSSKLSVDKSAGLEFSQPTRPTILIVVVLILVFTGAYFMFPSIAPIFFAAPILNGIIVGVFLLGVCACFFQIYTI